MPCFRFTGSNGSRGQAAWTMVSAHEPTPPRVRQLLSSRLGEGVSGRCNPSRTAPCSLRDAGRLALELPSTARSLGYLFFLDPKDIVCQPCLCQGAHEALPPREFTGRSERPVPLCMLYTLVTRITGFVSVRCGLGPRHGVCQAQSSPRACHAVAGAFPPGGASTHLYSQHSPVQLKVPTLS